MTTAGTAPLGEALREARRVAFPPGEFVGQESFVTARQIRTLAHHGGIVAGTRVVDLCCGVAGPGLLLVGDYECQYLGVDADADSIALAREGAASAGLRADFEVARVPPLPAGRFDVVVLLETMLAFRAKDVLLQAIASALHGGGRFVFTVEEGPPLNGLERERMPASETVWPVTLHDLGSALEELGLRTVWTEDWTRSHADTARALAASYATLLATVPPGPDRDAVAGLVDSHRLWAEWLGAGRMRKFAVVAERLAASGVDGG
ncbi:cyclopropane-fatty-acyl-phospholipid synthase family protein [Nostocoides sp. F2B08]|uniref:SAM-dependent methyltransferase n=1 Tax=Nostocoides sp. F2B08 TaxID=2653936 RepID=UPI00186B33F0|nr:class I SAM-dependent methyltransferase [Tetrasphaera sp. F2B08]